MIKTFRKAILHGAGYKFKYNGRIYTVLDDFIIYHEDSDTIYYKDTDF